MSGNPPTKSNNLLAAAGGNATAAGVSFQAEVGALFAAQLLAERYLDPRLALPGTRVLSVRFETEAPVDDILLETDAGGWIFVQAKSSLTLSSTANSELGGIANQLVRQWQASASGNAGRGWDRPLDMQLDRIVIAVGRRAAASITETLASALTAVQADATAPLPSGQQTALDTLEQRLRDAWTAIFGTQADEAAVQSLLRYVRIVQFDFEGADRQLVIEWLRSVLAQGHDAEAAFGALARYCQALMTRRLGTDAGGLRQALEAAGLQPKSAPSFHRDIGRLQSYSNETQLLLGHYEETKVGADEVKIDRECTDAVITSAAAGSLLLIGEPGSGKSAVLNTAARRLHEAGHDVIALAVDRLDVGSSDELQRKLGLEHPLRDVLGNWPGPTPAFVFIDALDATRGGAGEAVFRNLIREVLEIGGRWRLMASIRTFDLRLGEQFRELFKGAPAVVSFADPSFPDVRHIRIPPWTEAELDRVLELAPAIKTAIDRGGASLHELALVPFNTRLLADLISLGLPAETFGQVASQVQLLQLYWRYRIARAGTAAELCLRQVVSEMVAGRALIADKLSAARDNGNAFDALLRENVLILLPGDRRTAFRHHILFDYAASRVYLDPDNIGKTAALLPSGSDLGLMLAPALSFALQSLWGSSGPERASFWEGICLIAGTSDSDPIARSVAARTACEFPVASSDTAGFASLLHASGDPRVRAISAFGHIVGALAIRLEDQAGLVGAPWCTLAYEASDIVAEVVWPLRTLLFLLTERVQDVEGSRQLGVAARRLLRYALDDPTIASHLTIAAIGFVADTCATDAPASTALLRELLDPGRIQRHGHEDLPWLARKIQRIWNADPEFAVEIYGKTFGSAITDQSKTSLGQSRILPLSSTRQQDFGMAQFQLKEVFRDFLASHPAYAVRALTEAVVGHITVSEKVDFGETPWTIMVEGRTARLVEDGSRLWAWNPNDEHGDNVAGLLKTLVQWLHSAPAPEACRLAALVIEFGGPAVLWSRLFLVGAQRPEELGGCLWAYAVLPPFLTLSDTRKDAIDLIAARYPYEPAAAKEEFERKIFGYDFSSTESPTELRRVVLKRLVATIGVERLATDEARAFFEQEFGTEPQRVANPRPYSFEVSSRAPDQWWWLKDTGVETGSPANEPLLVQAEEIQTAFGLGGRPATEINDFTAAVAQLRALTAAAEAGLASGTDRQVADYAAGMAAAGAKLLAHFEPPRLIGERGTLNDLTELIIQLSQHPAPIAEADEEDRFENSHGWGFPAARIDAAEAAIVLCRADSEIVKRIAPALDRLLRDSHPVVRLVVAQDLTALWETDRPLMWRLVTQVASQEPNRAVLYFFANACLARLLHADPPQVEALVISLLERTGRRDEKPTTDLLGEIGSLIALLWVSHGRATARQLLEDWLSAIPDHQAELSHAIAAIRDGLVLGYTGTERETDGQIRQRCQEFAGWTVEASAAGLERFFAAGAAPGSIADEDAAVSFARTLGQIGDQLYFASGAFRADQQHGPPPLGGAAAKKGFFDDIEPLLRRIGDVAHPQTIHNLIDLLDFLAPAAPARVFDLVAHAFLGAGKRQGYQFESMGADRFVQIIGRFLADNREIFADPARRSVLIACLDAFSEVGWPAARRLLYRLPELLR